MQGTVDDLTQQLEQMEGSVALCQCPHTVSLQHCLIPRSAACSEEGGGATGGREGSSREGDQSTEGSGDYTYFTHMQQYNTNLKTVMHFSISCHCGI